MNSVVFIVTVVLIGFVSCQSPRFNASFVELVQEIVEDSSKGVGGVKNSSESVLDMGFKVKDAMEELLEDTLDSSKDNGANSTEFAGIDANGCNRGLKTQLEDKCDLAYDRVNEEAQQIEDDREKIEAVCCALEDFEKCSLRAYDKANCVTDKAAIKENLKAARLFLSVVADISCTEFRGFAFCESRRFNSSSMETVTEIMEDSNSTDVSDEVKNVSESALDMGSKVKDAMEELLGDLSNDNGANSTEFAGIDANGCNWDLKTQLEYKCDLAYDRVNEEAQQIEDHREKTEVVCCALEDFEKCSFRAYDKANCFTEKAAIKENLKAARLFLIVVADISCTEFRGFAFCASRRFNSSFIETVTEIVEDSSSTAVSDGIKNVSESALGMGSKVKDAMEESVGDFSNDNGANSTEFAGIDANGCDQDLKKQLEDKCDLAYDRVNEAAQQIEDHREKTETVCCALENLEKCSLRAYDKANCVTDKATIKENLKAARLFLRLVAAISCTEFRAQCAFYNSGAAEYLLHKF